MNKNKKTIINTIKVSSIIAITFITACLIYSVATYIATSSSQSIQNTTDSFSTQYSYLIDTEKKYTDENIQYQFNNFTEIEHHNIPYQLKNQTYWVKIKVSKFSTTFDHVILHADNSMLDTFKIFNINDNKITSTLFDIEAIDKSNIKKRIFPYITLDLSEKISQELLIKIETDSPPDVPLEFYLPENFNERVSLTLFVFGLLVGIILLMAMYNLVFYFAVKNKIYLFYIGYSLSMLFALATTNGFGYYLFPYELQLYFTNIVATFHYAITLFLALFTLYFLNYEKDNTPHFKISIYAIILFVLCGIFTIPLDGITETKIFFLLMPVTFIFFAYLAIVKLKNSMSWAKYYFISWVPLVLGCTIQPLSHFNIIESNFLVTNAYTFAVMIEIIFLSFALAERMKKTEKERINDLYYHNDSKLPRKGILEQALLSGITKENGHKLSVVVIKPEHIEKISLYIKDYFNTQFFIDLTQSINDLVKYNDAVLPITHKNEKIAYIEPYSLALILDENLSEQSLQAFVESILYKVRQSYKIKELNLPLFANIGISSYPENSANPQKLISEALAASIKASNTESGWFVFDSQYQIKDDYLLNLASSMSNAIANNEFEIYHQPQIDLKTLRVCGSECLIRWYYQGEGFVSPVTFIPIAEDIGLIKELTRWVINHSLQQHKMIMINNKNHMVSINISGSDINDDNFVRFIEDTIKEHDVPAEKIILELTESTAITNESNGIANMQKLIDLGIRMSIDDFGTGYSSMSYLSQLPCQELKIDREFVENIKNNPRNKIISETTVKMAKGLNLEVVAEGINSKDDENTLRTFGCDIGQGFYYAKPMPIEHYLIWLKKEVNGKLPEDEIL